MVVLAASNSDGVEPGAGGRGRGAARRFDLSHWEPTLTFPYVID
jgi:hypothetical protein